MKIESSTSDELVLQTVGSRLAQLRLAKDLTQKQVAEQAGLGLRTLQRLELGDAATHLSGFVRVCRVLGLLDRLDAFIPEPAPSPIELMKLQGRQRHRASGQAPAPGEAKKWTWGESS